MPDNRGEFVEVIKDLIGWEDNKIWTTLKELTTRPGAAIKAYCNGETQRYLSPIVYFFALSAAYYYLLNISGAEDKYVADATPTLTKLFGTSANRTLKFFMGGVGEKIIDIPVLIFSQWLIFRQCNKSFKQNTWFILFIDAHASWLSILWINYWWFTKTDFSFEVGGHLDSVISFAYKTWAAREFYSITLFSSILRNVILVVAYGLFTLIGVFVAIQVFDFFL
jgi:hypothetical protein